MGIFEVQKFPIGALRQFSEQLGYYSLGKSCLNDNKGRCSVSCALLRFSRRCFITTTRKVAYNNQLVTIFRFHLSLCVYDHFLKFSLCFMFLLFLICSNMMMGVSSVGQCAIWRFHMIAYASSFRLQPLLGVSGPYITSNRAQSCSSGALTTAPPTHTKHSHQRCTRA